MPLRRIDAIIGCHYYAIRHITIFIIEPATLAYYSHYYAIIELLRHAISCHYIRYSLMPLMPPRHCCH